jgi:Transposase DDE domain
MLMFTSQPTNRISLEDLANEFCETHGITISKQAIQERFNDYAVIFMQKLLKEQLLRQLSLLQDKRLTKHFTRLRIKDSTRFSLPPEYASLYKGHGGMAGPAQISIQFEYDLIENKIMHLDFTSANRNDQQDSKETLGNIKKGELLIRDLGYAGMGYMKHISQNEAYFLNRLNSITIAYDKSKRPIDYKKVLKKLTRHSIPCMEIQAFLLVDKEWLPTRLIISKVDAATYQKRIQKTSLQTQKKGHKVSDAYRVSAWLNLFVTNIPHAWLAAKDVRDTYSLRWQIELIFKIWKSQCGIHKIASVKIQRFQCELIAKFLWILLHWQLFRIIQKNVKVLLSTCKFYKIAHRLSQRLRIAISNPLKLLRWFDLIFQRAPNKYRIESKKGKPQLVTTLLNLLA